MAINAAALAATTFGWVRFVDGLGVGALVAATGDFAEARPTSERTGVEIPEAVPAAAGEIVPVTEGRAGFAGLFSGTYIFPTILLGLMSATALMLVYSLNTWLPELMLRVGFNAK